MQVSYHNHTNMSDGNFSLAEMLDGACRAGLDAFGISDHFVLSPGGHSLDWSMPLDFLEEYVDTLRAAKARAPWLRIGVEADYFPETVDRLRARLASLPFDYVIGSVHIVDGFCVDLVPELWAAIDQEERNARWRLYWVRLRELAESGFCDFVGHLDLPKKFGYLPTIDLTAEETAALDAIAAAGIAIELNTAGWDKPIGEAYPSLRLLREARRRDISLVISADAHQPQDVANHYTEARALARQAGYTETVGFEARKKFNISLEY